MNNKKYLVAFYSISGNTKMIAQKVASELNADINEIVYKNEKRGFFGFIKTIFSAMKKEIPEISGDENDPSDYDIVIIGTPVWGGNITPPIVAYVEKYKDKLKYIASIITSGGNIKNKNEKSVGEQITEKLVNISGADSLGYLHLFGKHRNSKNAITIGISDFISSIT